MPSFRTDPKTTDSAASGGRLNKAIKDDNNCEMLASIPKYCKSPRNDTNTNKYWQSHYNKFF